MPAEGARPPTSDPAVLVGYRNDVLAWNRMGHALIFGHLPFDGPDRAGTRPNWIKLIFCDPHMREFYVDWKTKAQDAVAYLRLVSGQHPSDPRVAALIGDLSVNSPEFARLWAGHAVRQCRSSVRGFRHPLVGSLTLSEEVMALMQDAGQRIVVYSAEQGSPSEAALHLLAGVTADQARPKQHASQCSGRVD
jgi:MmyB-like transcription regulator ligand binding domain